MTTINLASFRSQFPALQQVDEAGQPYIFFDGPAGTQVPQSVINAFSHFYTHANSNVGGHFTHSNRAGETAKAAREAMADFLNAPSPNEIVFGPSASSLIFNVSRAMGRQLKTGDEIIVTRLDHDANISPWLALEEQGIVVKFVDFDVETYRLDMDNFAQLLSNKTKLVAVGYASNALGTINPIKEITKAAHAVGAKVWVDAVHYAPHSPIDVQALNCDFLVCSVYKFFGPHMGVLWGRYELLDELDAYKVRPAKNTPPDKFETGTGNYEGMAGTTAAINYLANLGDEAGQGFKETYQKAGFTGRRLLLKQAMATIEHYERQLLKQMLHGFQTMSDISIYGITDEALFQHRTPTLAIRKKGISPADIAKKLGNHNIFVWDGHYYAVEVVKRLGLDDKGGMVRIGIVHYNTVEEVERLLVVVGGC